MTPSRQSLGQSPDFHRGAAEFQERGVRFCDVQDSHCSRRIFLKAFAKTLNRNSRSTRCFPRAPISFACAGSASKVSMDVANWIASPCGTSFFFFNDTATTEIYTLSLHDALPI